MEKKQLNLNGFTFQELHTQAGLERLDNVFLNHLKALDIVLCNHLLAYREQRLNPANDFPSQLVIDCAAILEAFLAHMFQIEDEISLLQVQTLSHLPIFAFKAYYISKQARRGLNKVQTESFAALDQWLENQLLMTELLTEDRQLSIAQLGLFYLKKPDSYAVEMETLTQWCIAGLTQEQGREMTSHWEMFHLPRHLDFANLVAVIPVENDDFGRWQGKNFRHRDGFNLTDQRMSQRQVMSEIDYCVYCHKNQGDFCSRGFPVKKGDPTQGLKINPVGETLTGCPLEEKISEMHVVKKAGFGIGALAVIMIDNPMCPMTGHRICNDCMQACIYQKQDPVNIPQTETGILTDVLKLPWGVEIYDLLTRWNPLRQTQWVVKPYNGLKVLVMGMGPAGFTLAHHLLMEGFAVVGADGLKLEPLPHHYLHEPILQFSEITENLSDRIMAGFGGVAEYGITVRWDKNFLKLIYINLMRRPYFQTFGGVRFGGTLKVEDAWVLGFDHLALAVGAGLPKELSIPHSLAPGMRQANDFLMALQLTGAAKDSSLANLQVRLPAVVIGGGLTGVDTATEVQAYYIVQVEKILARYRILTAYWGENHVRSRFLSEDLIILDEFLNHAQEVEQERETAQQESRQPDFLQLIRRWGGVTIAYRKTMQESPAYRRNPEELSKAFEEGIYYAEGLEPTAVLLDEQGNVKALRCQWFIWDKDGQWIASDEQQILPAHSVFVATGARLNVAYEFEHRGTFLRSDRFEYQRFSRENLPVNTQGHVKIPEFGGFTSYIKDHRRVTFLGDTHPIFHGSVVKAMASAKRLYPEIVELLKAKMNVGDQQEYQLFHDSMEYWFRAKVVSLQRHTAKVVELTVRAPLAGRNCQPGQFYRLQNYECLAPEIDDTRLQMEGLAVLGIPHPTEPDLLSFFIHEVGASSRLVQWFKPDDHVSVMGPTGAASTHLLESMNILLIEAGLSPAYLLSMAAKYWAEGHRILYVAYYDQVEDVYCRERIEAAADVVIWVSNQGKIPTHRPQDFSFEGEVVEALHQYALMTQDVTRALSSIQQVTVIGSSCLLYAIKEASQGILKDHWPATAPVTASVYGPMQCMLKGVCAQCLQWQIDPLSGKRTKAVYACSWQHQPLERVDIGHIEERLSQNRCQETLTNLWLDYLLCGKI